MTLLRRRRRLAVPLTLLWLVTSPLLAQQPTPVVPPQLPAQSSPLPLQTLTLDQALALAGQANPSLSAAALGPAVAEGALRQAGAYPNPELSLEGQLENLSRVESYAIEYSQEIELGGKRQARIDAAQAGLDEARLQVLDKSRLVRQKVKEGFAELLFSQQVLAVRQRILELSGRTLDLSRQRLVLGDIPGIDVIQLEGELARIQASLEEEAGRRAAAAANLSQALGAPGGDTSALGVLGRPVSLPSLESLQAAASQRPDLQAAALRVRVRQAAVRVEETRGISNLTAAAGLTRERLFIDGDAVSPPGVVDSISDPSWVLGLRVSMPLPFNDTNQGSIEQAVVRVDVARLEEQAVRQTVQTEVASAYHSLVAARIARSRLVTEAIPKQREVLEIIEKAYSLGARDLIDVLNARQQYLDALLLELESARQEELSLVRLEAALAADLAPILPQTQSDLEPSP